MEENIMNIIYLLFYLLIMSPVTEPSPKYLDHFENLCFVVLQN